jgi:parvulin-like peptidyl-prolyl isomerase
MYQGPAQSDAVRTKQEALDEITALLERINAGEDFAAIAQKMSDCPSGEDGGDLGFFQRGDMVPEFDEAAFALEPNQTSGVVETAFGFHLIQRTE